MRKILIAVAPSVLNRNMLALGAYLARLTRSSVTGVMMENLKTARNLTGKNTYEGTFIDPESDTAPVLSDTQRKRMRENLNAFQTYFGEQGITCHIHEDKGTPIGKLIQETRFADMLILDAETSFAENPEATPTDFVKRILLETECPVLIAPLSFEGLDEIVFTYNGSSSCMYAIKQFSNLLPQLNNKRVTVLQVNDLQETDDPRLNKLNEWLQTRYSNVYFENLTGPTDTQLLGFMLKKERAITVMGAYGRSQLSQFLKPSAASVLIKTIHQPLFIAHP